MCKVYEASATFLQALYSFCKNCSSIRAAKGFHMFLSGLARDLEHVYPDFGFDGSTARVRSRFRDQRFKRI